MLTHLESPETFVTVGMSCKGAARGMIVDANRMKKSNIGGVIGGILIFGLGIASVWKIANGYWGFYDNSPLRDLSPQVKVVLALIHTLVFVVGGAYMTFRSGRDLIDGLKDRKQGERH